MNQKNSDIDRRDFLKLFGLGALATAVSCVRQPVKYVNSDNYRPPGHNSGNSIYYATVCRDCSASCGVIVKTKNGRPVKLEGNPNDIISQGATCGLGQSSLQELYHPERLKNPKFLKGVIYSDIDWKEFYSQISNFIKQNKKIAIFSSGSTGHQNDFYKKFLKAVGSKESRVYNYDSNNHISYVAKAHEMVFGRYVIPNPYIDKANYIVGINSDFLENGISPVSLSKRFSKSMMYNEGKKGEFIQFEPILSLTGSQADKRYIISANDDVYIALGLLNSIYNNLKTNIDIKIKNDIKEILIKNKSLIIKSYNILDKNQMDHIASDLISRKSCVLAGSSVSFGENATKLQIVTALINLAIGAYDEILDIKSDWINPHANDLERFLKEYKDIDVLFIINSNPLFTIPKSWGIDKIFKNIPKTVSIQPMLSENDKICDYVLPGHHFLESFGDQHKINGYYSLMQPVVRPLTNSKQAEDILIDIAKSLETDLNYNEYYEFLKEKWQQNIYELSDKSLDFEMFFTNTLKSGFFKTKNKKKFDLKYNLDVKSLSFNDKKTKGLTLLTSFHNLIKDGKGANRPILQESGDSLTTITWGNAAIISKKLAKDLKLQRNDLIKIDINQEQIEIPVYPIPGMSDNSVLIHRGYGKKDGSKISEDIGVDPLVLIKKSKDSISSLPIYFADDIKISKLNKKSKLATLQKYDYIENRRKDICKQTSLSKSIHKINKKVDLDKVPDMYPKHPETEYRWGMSIDLNKCIGCSACMVSCGLENNVAQVGKTEVLKGREMSWLRLDRYFSNDKSDTEVKFQPMMCQQCNHAPCEAVCPVYATVHDIEGINAMVYPRCVGTRYCAQACPYKVRRFNYWNHGWNMISKTDAKDRNPVALNPDVTVRTAGVIEKCNFCYQRLAEEKYKRKIAKAKGLKIGNTEVKTACQQVCPTDAISFGNLNEKSSDISKKRSDSKAYLVLGGDPEHKEYGIKTLPNVSYLAKVKHDKFINKNDHHG